VGRIRWNFYTQKGDNTPRFDMRISLDRNKDIHGIRFWSFNFSIELFPFGFSLYTIRSTNG